MCVFLWVCVACSVSEYIFVSASVCLSLCICVSPSYVVVCFSLIVCLCLYLSVCLYMPLCVAIFNIKDCTVLIYMLNILNDFGFKKSFFMLYLNVKYFVIALSLCLFSLITPLHRSLLRVFSLFLSFCLWYDCDIIQGFFLILQDLSTGRRRRAQRG